MCTQQQFICYIRYVALDTISNGKYRKIVQQAANEKKEWALEMLAAKQSVHIMRTTIVALLLSVNEAHLHNIYIPIICVLYNNSPPIHTDHTKQQCYITGKTTHSNINITCSNFHSKRRISTQLSQKTGKTLVDLTHNSKIFINTQFKDFFLMVWYVTKMDNIIKVYTRHWILNNKNEKLQSMASICNSFLQNTNSIWLKMYTLLMHSKDHVHTSIQTHVMNTQTKIA
jgi:hypothetical protein